MTWTVHCSTYRLTRPRYVERRRLRTLVRSRSGHTRAKCRRSPPWVEVGIKADIRTVRC